jgi:hypothetical protein
MPEKKAVNGNISFTIGDVSHVVDISPAGIAIAFERHFDTPATILQMAPRLEYIAFLAWSAACRAGLPVPDDFDEFVNVVDDLEVIDTGVPADANPTAGGQ